MDAVKRVVSGDQLRGRERQTERERQNGIHLPYAHFLEVDAESQKTEPRWDKLGVPPL